ncbi:EF-Tu/IF-2/RF-3 family GTPase [Microbacterium resistens]|uniref:EF-Tu/IF-2/RF-3 family GTPase n=1 Tax=Microbacterium resistens TaxID=156977 RepID=UPI00366B0C85
MGWFGKKRDRDDASETLRRYNEAEAARLAALTNPAEAAHPAEPTLPVTLDAGPGAGEFRVEDVFTITGRGIVATGTVLSGTMRVDQDVEILRGGAPVAASRVTGIEMFRKKATEVGAGTNAGILLRGRPAVERGDVIRASSPSA